MAPAAGAGGGGRAGSTAEGGRGRDPAAARAAEGAVSVGWVAAAAAAAVAAALACRLPGPLQPPGGAYFGDPLGAEVVEQQDRVAALRRRLGPGGHVASTAAAELGAALEKLHGMPPFRGLGGLNSSSHRYGTGRLLGDAATITGYQKGMLLLGRPVQILDVPSLQLPAPGVDWQWAAYNPSFVLVRWRGKSVILVAYRMSTWNLCTWAGDGSPLERLPVVKGKRRTTSKVVAAILRPDFAVVVPPRPVVGTNYSSHYCTHHSGMVRMGVDDARLFSIGLEPFMLYAAVAPEGHHSYCFHNMMLCALELPPEEDGRVRCKDKIRLRFGRADEISERHRAEGRLANVHQKNWVPLVLGESLYLIFTIEPLVVVLVDRATGECTEISEARTPAMHGFYASAGLHDQGHSTMGVHGGSPLIPLPESDAGEFLGIGRIARGNTQYALFFFTVARDVSGPEGTVSFSAPSGFRLARVSPIVCLASTTAHHRGLCETIQFAGGMILGGTIAGEGNLAISYGANDCEGKVAVLPLARVLGLLRPAGAAQGRSRARA